MMPRPTFIDVYYRMLSLEAADVDVRLIVLY